MTDAHTNSGTGVLRLNSSSPPVQGPGGDGEWSVGRVLKRNRLSNYTVYQDMLIEMRRKGLSVASRSIIAELGQEIQHLHVKVSISHTDWVLDSSVNRSNMQLQEYTKLTQPDQLEALQQMMKKLHPLLTYEQQEAANRNTREMEEENPGLHQQVSLILSHITCSTHTHTRVYNKYTVTLCPVCTTAVCCEFDDSNYVVLYRRR